MFKNGCPISGNSGCGGFLGSWGSSRLERIGGPPGNVGAGVACGWGGGRGRQVQPMRGRRRNLRVGWGGVGGRQDLPVGWEGRHDPRQVGREAAT